MMSGSQDTFLNILIYHTRWKSWSCKLESGFKLTVTYRTVLIVSLGVTDSFFSTSPSRIQKCTFLTILQVVQVHLYLCCKYVVCFLHVGPMNRDIYLSKALDTKARWEKFVLANHFVVYPKWKGDWKDKGRHSLIICLSQKPFKLFNKTFVSLDGAIETNVTTTFTRMRFQTTARSSMILI